MIRHYPGPQPYFSQDKRSKIMRGRSQAKILLIEDDLQLAALLKLYLQQQEFSISHVANAESAVDMLPGANFDLLVLDWTLPGMSGLNLVRKLRAEGTRVNILMLTAISDIDDMEEAFTSGVNDYLTKPFEMRELAARIRALLRRPSQTESVEITHKDLSLDPRGLRLTKNGRVIPLLPIEYSLLEFFMQHQGQIFTAQNLLSRVWKPDTQATEVAVRSTITRLRRKIDYPGQSSYIQTHIGSGYSMGEQTDFSATSLQHDFE